MGDVTVNINQPVFGNDLGYLCSEQFTRAVTIEDIDAMYDQLVGLGKPLG